MKCFEVVACHEPNLRRGIRYTFDAHRPVVEVAQMKYQAQHWKHQADNPKSETPKYFPLSADLKAQHNLVGRIRSCDLDTRSETWLIPTTFQNQERALVKIMGADFSMISIWHQDVPNIRPVGDAQLLAEHRSSARNRLISGWAYHTVLAEMGPGSSLVVHSKTEPYTLDWDGDTLSLTKRNKRGRKISVS